MALIKCTACGHMISDKAKKCPKCGCPIDRQDVAKASGNEKFVSSREPAEPVYYYENDDNGGRKKWSWIIFSLLFVGIVGVVIFGVAYYNHVKNKEMEAQTFMEALELSKLQQDGINETVLTKDEIIQNLIDNMVSVEGGTFTMGATSEQGSDAYDNEIPAHKVTLSSFSIGKYEVTQEEWEAVMGKNPSEFKGAKRPVENVSWDDCQEFIRKLNQLTGKQFRLPTEAEWEYAARGGNRSRGYKYSGSDNIGSVAWYGDNSGRTTHPVGQKQANELGLYDMSGNVWEWCQDWYGNYSSSAQTNPTGPTSGSYRVGRGDDWGGDAGSCRVSGRLFFAPGGLGDLLGLRLAL